MSRRHRSRFVVVVAATLGSFGAACQLIAGIKDHRFQVEVQPDEAGAADSASTESAAPLDPCVHLGLPERPDAAFDGVTNRYIFAVRTVDFSGGDDAGQPLGFDLDGVCTCDPRPYTAHAGATSCTPPGGQSLCDGDGGVDNALFGPFRQIAAALGPAGAGKALLGTQAECGRETLLLVLRDYNGKADDAHVSVGLIPSYGIQESHDAGEIPDSSCTTSPDPPYPAKWDGTDKWSFAMGTALRQGGEVFPVINSPDAFVTGYRLVVPPVRAINLFLGAQSVEVSSPATIATLVGVDADGNDVLPGAAAAGYRLADGMISGRIAVGALLSTVGQFKPKSADGGLLCNDVFFSNLVKGEACRARDIQSDPAKDFQPPGDTPFACDAVSTAISFTGQMAQIGNGYSPDAGPEAGCPAEWPICP